MAKPICRTSSSTAILEKCEKLRADQKSTSVDFGIEEGCIALAFFSFSEQCGSDYSAYEGTRYYLAGYRLRLRVTSRIQQREQVGGLIRNKSTTVVLIVVFGGCTHVD